MSKIAEIFSSYFHHSKSARSLIQSRKLAGLLISGLNYVYMHLKIGLTALVYFFYLMWHMINRSELAVCHDSMPIQQCFIGFSPSQDTHTAAAVCVHYLAGESINRLENVILGQQAGNLKNLRMLPRSCLQYQYVFIFGVLNKKMPFLFLQNSLQNSQLKIFI